MSSERHRYVPNQSGEPETFNRCAVCGERAMDDVHITVNEQLLEILPKLDRPTLERVAMILINECGYLYEHHPEGDELIGKFKCSDDTYHVPPCGHGTTEGNCEAGEPEPWCANAGFDCPTCAAVTELEEIVKQGGGQTR